MQYTEVTFRFSFSEPWQQDVFIQGLADMGFESFEGDTAYISTTLFRLPLLQQYVTDNGQEIVSVKQCTDTNWNAAWEAEHGIVQLPYNIVIHPQGAFGAGDHATTSMMLDAIAAEGAEIVGKQVLDMGCGTGVLGIMAAKQGAAYVIAVDIDERAVASTKANAALNNTKIDAIQGAALPAGLFHYILANIHRNILLSLLPSFYTSLHHGGKLMLSGFYENDINTLVDTAEKNGFCHIGTRSTGEWRMITLQKIK